MTPAPAEKPPTVRQRWMAAQRLAAGERMAGAAAYASMPLAQLRQLMSEDADFRELYDAEVEQAALTPEERRRRMDLQNRQAIERALADGRVSIIGALLRLDLGLPALAKNAAGRKAAAEALRDLDDGKDEREDDEDDNENGLDDETWLASLPVVEADPEREALRRRALLKVEPKAVRRVVGHAPLRGIEQYLVADDPVAYEEWFARQPKPPRSRAKSLTAEDAAAVAWVTRHNPPWIRGEYLGYYRPPVPAHLFLPGAKGDDLPANVDEASPAQPEPATATAESPVAALRARIVRLLDRTAPRLPEEADLAEAICALKWPKWPEYRGGINPFQLRRALSDIRLDDTTVNWLASHELARACRAAVKQAQGP